MFVCLELNGFSVQEVLKFILRFELREIGSAGVPRHFSSGQLRHLKVHKIAAQELLDRGF